MVDPIQDFPTKNENSFSKFSGYLKDLRQRKGMSIAELAKLSNVSQSYINRLELSGRKEPSINIVIRLAEALGVKPHYFLDTLYSEPTDLIEVLRSNPEIQVKGKTLSEEEVEKLIKIIELVSEYSD